MVTAEPRRDAAGIELLRYTAAELAFDSPTFLQMLEAVKGAPNVMLRARPLTGRRTLGRGRFVVAGGFTIGLMEIHVHRRDPHLRVRAIAHETAHAAEIACLPPQSDTAALRQILVDRATRQGLAGGDTIETSFAIAAEAVVFREYYGHRAAGGQLPILATTYELPLCQGGHPAARPPYLCASSRPRLFGNAASRVTTDIRGTIRC